MPKIFVVTHAETQIPKADYLVKLHVGAANANFTMANALRDDQGDNISVRNPYYAEITGLYWMWKNATDDLIGLCHYRRFFCPLILPGNAPFAASFEHTQMLLGADGSGMIFDAEMRLAEMIVPMPMLLNAPLDEQYIVSHDKASWDATIVAIQKLHPEEAQPAKNFFRNTKALVGYNMFIARRAMMNAYCEWLFPILFEVERNIVPSEDPYQRKVYGFLAERLFSWWITRHHTKLIYRPVLNIMKPEQLGSA